MRVSLVSTSPTAAAPPRDACAPPTARARRRRRGSTGTSSASSSGAPAAAARRRGEPAGRRWGRGGGRAGRALTGSTLRAPAGRPARRASSARARALSGVSSDGFSTHVHPAACRRRAASAPAPEVGWGGEEGCLRNAGFRDRVVGLSAGRGTRAGAALRVTIARGKFQGVISAHGPTGWPTPAPAVSAQGSRHGGSACLR